MAENLNLYPAEIFSNNELGLYFEMAHLNSQGTYDPKYESLLSNFQKTALKPEIPWLVEPIALAHYPIGSHIPLSLDFPNMTIISQDLNSYEAMQVIFDSSGKFLLAPFSKGVLIPHGYSIELVLDCGMLRVREINFNPHSSSRVNVFYRKEYSKGSDYLHSDQSSHEAYALINRVLENGIYKDPRLQKP